MLRSGLRLIVAGAMLCASAEAHDESDWIMNQKLVDPLSKEWCCSRADCIALPTGGVDLVAGGYLLTDTKEVVPFSRALPKSPDGRYWRCHRLLNGGKVTRCLIIPPDST